MTEAGTPLIIKRYAGTRLYDPAAGAYVTLDDLAQWVEDDEDLIVTEAETGEDITRSVLKQIIVERRRHG
jgi:polyhydroxyalkanoate synthesis repressor PhaR